jgi:hypothetical protein
VEVHAVAVCNLRRENHKDAKNTKKNLLPGVGWR